MWSAGIAGQTCRPGPARLRHGPLGTRAIRAVRGRPVCHGARSGTAREARRRPVRHVWPVGHGPFSINTVQKLKKIKIGKKIKKLKEKPNRAVPGRPTGRDRELGTARSGPVPRHGPLRSVPCRAWAGPNSPCLGPARLARPIWPPILRTRVFSCPLRPLEFFQFF